MDYSINIDAKDIIRLKKKLDDLSNNKFPIVVRESLNDLAFEMKGKGSMRGTIDKRSDSEFDYRRNKTFIKSVTGVNKAKGKDIDKMQSQSGVVDSSSKQKDKAAERLSKQEQGGTLRHSFVPLRGARKSQMTKKPVRAAFRHKRLRGIVDLTNIPQNKVLGGLIVASSMGSPVLIKGRGKRKNNKYLAFPGKRIKQFTNKKIKVPLTFLYLQIDDKTVNLSKKRQFVQKAGEDAFKKAPQIIKKQFEKAFDKLKK